MAKLTSTSLRFIPAALGLACCLSAYNAKAQSQYFTTVTNGGSYSWDAANWNASGSTANTGPYTFNWTPGDFARFYNGAGDTYTVTVNASEGMTGLYNDTTSTLNINDAGGGLGSLNVETAIQGFLSASGSSTYINVPIVGNGGVAPESSGSIYFGAANSYTAGTALGDSGNTLAYFNNPLSFSTGPITLNRTGNFSTLLSYGGQPITLANNFSTVLANTGPLTELNFASGANAPVTSSGTWTLGTVNLNLRSSGGSTAPLTISGAISGSGILALSANGTGNKTIISGANPFTGTVIVTGSSAVNSTYGGSGAITVTLGAANTLASISQLSMAGGTVDPGGLNQTMSGATVALTANSIFDFTSGKAIMTFANSSGVAWTSGMTLDLVATGGGNWNTSGDALEIGSDATGLIAGQLAEIEFNGGDLGDAGINAQGFIYDTAQPIPEPSTVVLSLLGGLGLLWNVRRRTV